MKFTILIILALAFNACTNLENPKSERIENTDSGLIDRNATLETKALYNNLKKLSKTNILYGHQDDMAYGVGWWNVEDRSDVKEVCGSYPAVFGWELGDLGQERSLDSVLFTDIQNWIVKAYKLGAVNTVSWHMDNPINSKDSWNCTKAVYSILPGGVKHNYYKNLLKTFAGFDAKLVDDNGTAIPIIFRPFHEQNGSWFWWGKNNCTKEEYKSLWQFTVHYLRDSLNIHNLIYVYSPDGQFDDYMDRYPGNDYVDVMGLDYYFRGKIDSKHIEHFTKTLIELTKSAKSNNKYATLSETGYQSLPDSLWHTKAILNPIKNNKGKIELAYMLCWRNANRIHHFTPYPGHPSAKDFKVFYSDPFTLFANDIKDLYK